MERGNHKIQKYLIAWWNYDVIGFSICGSVFAGLQNHNGFDLKAHEFFLIELACNIVNVEKNWFKLILNRKVFLKSCRTQLHRNLALITQNRLSFYFEKNKISNVIHLDKLKITIIWKYLIKFNTNQFHKVCINFH